MDRAISIRSKMLNGNGCSFNAVITADYSETVTTFTLSCQFDSNGNMSFSVIEPTSIAGITGKVSEDGGALTFDDAVLGFSLLADGQLSPVSAPWILIKTLRTGYLKACNTYDLGLHMIIDDSYEENALQLDIWTDTDDLPNQAEIVYDGRRILSIEIRNFVYL